MEKEKSREMLPIILNLVEKFGLLYIEYLNTRSLTNKLRLAASNLVKGIALILLVSIFTLTVWLGLMVLLFEYLQLYQFGIIPTVLILIAINVVLLFITVALLLKLKNKILSKA